MELSTLTTPELKQILRLARGRGDGLSVDRVQWELAERSALSTRLGASVEDLMFGDDAEPETPPARRMTFSDGEPLMLKRFEPPPPSPAAVAASRPTILPMVAAGVVVGALLTSGMFLAAGGAPRIPIRIEFVSATAQPKPVKAPKPAKPKALHRKPASRPPAERLQVASSDSVAGVLAPGAFPPMPEPDPAPTPPPPTPVAAAPVPAAEPAPALPPAAPPPPQRLQVELAKTDPILTPEPPARAKPAPEKPAVKQLAKAEVPKEPKADAKKAEPETRELAKAETLAGDPCARKATPADKAVCNDGSLKLFDRDLRRAYAQARQARVPDRILIADQTNWRKTRDRVSDPDRLARLYDRRIRELTAATRAARDRD